MSQNLKGDQFNGVTRLHQLQRSLNHKSQLEKQWPRYSGMLKGFNLLISYQKLKQSTQNHTLTPLKNFEQEFDVQDTN